MLRSSPFRRFSALGLACFGLVTTSLAQPQGTISPILVRNLPGPSFQDLAFGEVFGNEDPVVLSAENGTGRLYQGPAAFNGSTTVTGVNGVTSVTALRTGQPGAVDDIFMTNASGLVKVTGDTSWGLGAATTLLAGDWVNAVQIQHNVISGLDQIVGLNAARDKIVSAFDLGGGFWVTGTVLPMPANAQQIVDFDVVDHDADGTLEYAMLTDRDLWIYEQNGTPILVLRSYGGTEGAVSRVLDTGGERLAWATEDAFGTPILKVFNSAGIEPVLVLSAPVIETDPPQNVQVGHLTAGDIDEDGNADLLLTDTASRRALAMINLGGSQHFGLSTLGTDHYLMVLDFADPYGSGPTVPAVIADVVPGGANETVFALGSITTSMIISPGAFDSSPLPEAAAELIEPASNHLSVPGEVQINFAMDLPPSITGSSYTHVQAALWRQPTEGANLLSDAISNYVYPLNFNGQTLTDQQWIKIDVPEASVEWSGNQYYLRYRFVTVSSTPNLTVLSASKGYHSGFDMGNDTQYLQDLQKPLSAQLDISAVGNQPGEDNGTGPDAGNFIYTDVVAPTVSEPNPGALQPYPGPANGPWI